MLQRGERVTNDAETDIASMIDAQRRHQLARERAETHEQRMERFAELQAASFELLRSSPEGYAAFLRRNHTSRRAELINGIWQPVSPDRPSPEA